MRLEIGRRLEIHDPPDVFLKAAMRELTIPNPDYAQRKKHGRDMRGVSETLSFLWQETGGNYTAPRAFVAQAARMAKRLGIDFQLIQKLREKPAVRFESEIKLRHTQQRAVNDMVPFQFGTLQAPTGAGKTVMALALIAFRGQPTLVIVHTKELLTQWIDRIESFLKIPAKEIGVLGGGKKRIGKQITVGTYQTVRQLDDVALVPHFGHLVVDEVHRCPSVTFTEVVERFDTKYQLGLSATPYRRDDLTPLIAWYVGEVKHRVPKEELLAAGQICPAKVHLRKTNWRASEEVNPSDKFAAAINDMASSWDRNELIVRDVKDLLKRNEDEKILLLSARVDHCEGLALSFQRLGLKVAILHGQMNKGRRKKEMGLLREANVFCATGSLIGEGFDLPSLTALVIATPVKWSGRLIQYVGRVLRPAPGKDEAIIIDYVDFDEPVFFYQAQARIKTYKREPGFKIVGLDSAPN